MTQNHLILVAVLAAWYIVLCVVGLRWIFGKMDRNNPHVKTLAKLREQPDEGEKNNNI